MEDDRRCRLCPRQCLADRAGGQKGVCGTSELRIARIALHYWEEPCISGTEGSGAVFFSGCPLHCIYCQNEAISHGAGRRYTVSELSDALIRLAGEGANNWNFVTPTHFVPELLAALRLTWERGVRLPVVYNTSGYETVETLRQLEGYVDIYLPDYKYLSKELAARYSGAPDYPEVAKRALDEMLRQTGAPEFDEKGMLRRGVLVRHLVLPGHARHTKEVLAFLQETYGDQIYVSLMSQYTPPARPLPFKNLNRTVAAKSYERLVDYCLGLGMLQCYYQEGDVAKESFIPAFETE